MKKIYNTLATLLLVFNFGFSQTTLTEAVDFTVTTVHGEEINLFQLLDEGKHVVIDFFFTTCFPCTQSVPIVNEAFEKYGCNQGDVFFLSVDYGDTDAEVLQYEEYFGVLLPGVSGLDGGGNDVVSAYGVNTFPTIILIAPDRSIVDQSISPVSEITFHNAITVTAGIDANPDACNLVGVNDLEDTGYDIHKVYPNPTNSVAFVAFSMEASASVSVEVYNMVGQLVYSIPANDYTEGTHTLEINTEDMANGNYSIQLKEEAGNLVAVSKLTVLK